jgi:hypothetical protein
MLGGKAKIKIEGLALGTDALARKLQDQQIVFLNSEVVHEGHG